MRFWRSIIFCHRCDQIVKTNNGICPGCREQIDPFILEQAKKGTGA